MKKSKKRIRKLLPKRKKNEEAPQAEGVPRITTETIAEHREEVLGSARKYIYPLQHSKHRILLISVSVLIIGIISFFAYVTLSLYKFNSSSTFLYRVTQVLPLPVAKAGSQLVDYENYLFELRHYKHYYESQLKLDFKTPEGKEQLDAFKKQALDKVINDAYIKQLAEKYNLSVSDRELDEQIEIVRAQNRLGNSEQVFEDVLKDYWGWSVDDFRRTLRQQILAQKVVATLDTATRERAEQALGELKSGKEFSDVAKKYSDEQATKTRGGDFGNIERTNRDLTAKTVEALFNLKPGQYSEIINIGYSLEIVKNIENADDGRIHGAHIIFNFQNVEEYLKDYKDQEKTRTFIRV